MNHIPTLDQVLKSYITSVLATLESAAPIMAAHVVVDDGQAYVAGFGDALRAVALALGVSDWPAAVPAHAHAPKRIASGNAIKPNAAHPLSEREREVARLIAEGKSDYEIAHDLHVAYTTVRSHRRSIYKKLDVHGKAELSALVLHGRTAEDLAQTYQNAVGQR